MRRMLKLMGGIFRIALQRELAHRSNMLFTALVNTVGLAVGVGALALVFAQVETLAGWHFAEALALLGAFRLVSGLLETFVDPNLNEFNMRLTRGELDEVLLQPVPSLVLATLGTCSPWGLVNVGFGAALLGVGALQAGARLTLTGAVACLLLLAAGTVVAYAARVMLAAVAFWSTGSEANMLYFAFWQLGRYPVDIYKRPVRFLLTYLVPVRAGSHNARRGRWCQAPT